MDELESILNRKPPSADGGEAIGKISCYTLLIATRATGSGVCMMLAFFGAQSLKSQNVDVDVGYR